MVEIKEFVLVSVIVATAKKEIIANVCAHVDKSGF